MIGQAFRLAPEGVVLIFQGRALAHAEKKRLDTCQRTLRLWKSAAQHRKRIKKSSKVRD